MSAPIKTRVKRWVITLADKKQVIDAVEQGNIKVMLAQHFKMPEATVRRILKEKNAVKEALEYGRQPKKTRLTSGKHEQMEEFLAETVKESEHSNQRRSIEGKKIWHPWHPFQDRAKGSWSSARG